MITIADDDDSSFMTPPGGRPLASLIFNRMRVEVSEGESVIMHSILATDDFAGDRQRRVEAD